MSATRWQQLKEKFAEAEAMEHSERVAYLEREAERDPEMYAELESLLRYASPEPRTAHTSPLPVLDRYVLLEAIGRGGMGSVYLAERTDGEFDQQVAVKILRRGLDTDDVLRRFRAERQILAGLDHPNIARLIDGGSTGDGRPYFVMEYVDGDPIGHYCEEHRLGIAARLRLFVQVCSAIAYAHRNLIVHRDIKPANILVTRAGVPKLLDFGIAKLLYADPRGIASGLTSAEMRPMTPSHASPEQVRGQPITTASDVFSLGILLYELLTGRRPYDPDSDPASLEKQICETRPPRPSDIVTGTTTVPTGAPQIANLSVPQIRRRLRGDLDTIVSTALRKEPGRRYASVGLMAADIDAFVQGLPISAHADSVGYRLGKFLRRHWLGTVATGLVVATIVTLVTVYSLRLESERNLARLEAAKAQQMAEFLSEMIRSPNPTSSGVDVRVVDVLEEAQFTLDNAADLHPDVRDAVRVSLGDAYTGLGLIEPAEQQLRRVLADERARFGSDYPGSREALTALSRLHWQKGEYPESVDVSRRVVEVLSASAAPDPVELGDAHAELADALIFDSRLDQAREQIEISQTLLAQVPGQEIKIANNYVHLGRIYDRQGDFEQAVAMNLKGTEILEAQLGREHVWTQNAAVSLASIRIHQELWQEGAKLYREVVRVMEDKAGPDHMRTAQVAAMLASVETRLGNFEQSEALLKKCLDIHLEHLPDDHLMIAYDYYYLSELYTKTGRLDEALEYARRSLAISLETLGPSHGDTAYDYINLGDIHMQRAQPGAAREQYEKALAILFPLFGDANVRTREVLQQLIDACEAAGDSACAARFAARHAATAP